MVAGTAPDSRTAAAQRRATSRLCGGGSPCATTLVSSATARPAAIASRTSSEISSTSCNAPPSRSPMHPHHDLVPLRPAGREISRAAFARYLDSNPSACASNGPYQLRSDSPAAAFQRAALST